MRGKVRVRVRVREQVERLRVEGRAAHEHHEEEEADEHLREELRVAPLANEGGHGHEARLARHLEQLVEPERRLVLAAGEADARLVPREYRVVLVPLLGRRREVGAQREVQPGGDAERVEADEDERDGGAAARAALDVLEAREHLSVVVMRAVDDAHELLGYGRVQRHDYDGVA